MLVCSSMIGGNAILVNCSTLGENCLEQLYRRRWDQKLEEQETASE